jgi:hypothetical protein
VTDFSIASDVLYEAFMGDALDPTEEMKPVPDTEQKQITRRRKK